MMKLMVAVVVVAAAVCRFDGRPVACTFVTVDKFQEIAAKLKAAA